MKSLILKDLYNIGHNIKSLLFILLFMAILFITNSDIFGYPFISTIMCSMMIVTTFVFDDSSKWNQYALVMPLSKRDIVIGKYIVLAIFCLAGSLFGFIMELSLGLIFKKFAFTLAAIAEVFIISLSAFSIAFIFGSISIPLVFKFGSERGRILMVLSSFIPCLICFAIYKLLTMIGFKITDIFIYALLLCSPLIALICSYITQLISYGIF